MKYEKNIFMFKNNSFIIISEAKHETHRVNEATADGGLGAIVDAKQLIDNLIHA
jgi:hypothetical protein